MPPGLLERHAHTMMGRELRDRAVFAGAEPFLGRLALFDRENHMARLKCGARMVTLFEA